VGRVEPSQILALAEGYRDNPASRITAGVLSRIESVRCPARLRVGLFKLLCDQAAAREEARLKRGLPALRTIAIVSAPIGAIATAWDLAAIGLSWTCDTGDCLNRTGPSDSLSYTIAGILISIVAFITYKYLSARVETESANLRELSSMLAVNYSARS
jgi:biopolymer transport protein ExbB/TolQ